MDSAILNAQLDFATTEDLLTSFVSEDYGEPASSTWENSAISGSLSALSAFITLATTFMAGPLGAAVDTLKLIGGLASLGSAGATIGTGVLGAIIHQSVEIMERELRTAATAAEYVNQTVTSMRLAVIGMANDALYSPAYNPPVVSDNYYQNHTGIFSWLQGGVFAQEPPSNTEFKLTAKVLVAIYAIAVSNMWTQQFVYFVNASDLWDTSSGTTFANMSISHKDMSRTVIGKDTIIAIKHTDGAAPDQPYDAVPGVNALEQLGLTLAMMYESSAWAQTTGKGFNRTWTGSESVKALTGYDGDDLDIDNSYDNGPPNGIFANIPVCHLKGLIIQGRDNWGENLCGDEVSTLVPFPAFRVRHY
ncbi:uncharacterized protein N7459_002328 [Penicillium hispanicum]|uniref:uncharacterized protein n=1 Tax=Penicillium hispanicum TaxID=1080232 RepID=UPI00253F91EC|nr:uncharacterized protein N7459_002328 [Penicillium hispanicum]KAJ5591959.1 hypothetical protein N7459_002328 [Penicillium hispanicum]